MNSLWVVFSLLSLGADVDAGGDALAESAALEEPCALCGRDPALLSLGAGLAFGVTSMVAFTLGLDAERELRAGALDRAAADAALDRRLVAGLVAWPAALLSAAGFGAGVWLSVDDEGSAP